MAEPETAAPPAPLRRTSPMDRLRSRKRRTFRIVSIVLDPAKADRYNEARDKASQVKMRIELLPKRSERGDLFDELTEAEEAVEAMKAEVADDVQRFLFVSLSPARYDELVNEFPPTKVQKEQAKRDGERVTYDVDKFGPALLHECCVWTGAGDEKAPPEQEPPAEIPDEPVMTLDEWGEIWLSPSWNMAERMTLFLTAVETNTGRRLVDLGNG